MDSTLNGDPMKIDSDSQEKDIEGNELQSFNESGKIPKEKLFIGELRKWIIKSNTARILVDSLLKLIKPIVPEIPACVKTLLHPKPDLKFKIETYSDG